MPGTSPRFGAWGIDAVLSRHVDAEQRMLYLELLQASAVQIVRERGVEAREPSHAFHQIRGQGARQVLVFSQGLGLAPAASAWGPFPADLRVVHREAQDAARSFANAVDNWELPNEPELAWWPDMPDRYAAHAKALYLGLKAGAREAGHATPVLHGSLGLPAGPWLERSARNGLLSYGDAWNVHYYGDALQFTGFLNGHVRAMHDLGPRGEIINLKSEGGSPIRRWPVKSSPLAASSPATRAASGRVLPIWATEVGVRTVTPDTWADPARRRRQADWILETARRAVQHPHVAVFMPFVLVHKGDGYAMTESATETWPAWQEYARFTRENLFPQRPALRPPSTVNPVVLQWLADSQTASGHKLAAAYRWRADGAPIQGELRIYNLGEEPVSGTLSHTREPGDGGWAKSGNARSTQGRIKEDGGTGNARSPSTETSRSTWELPRSPITVPAQGMVSLPLGFPLEDAPEGGRREWRQFVYTEKSGRKALLGFALERSPDLYPPKFSPLVFGEWGRANPSWCYFPNALPTDKRGPWRTANGVKVLYAQGALARFELSERTYDPEYPLLAATRLPNGLPPAGWLRVATREQGAMPVTARVDLLDSEGRRFTQWENLGHVRGLPITSPRWLNLADFHPYAWGKLDEQRRLKPAEVRELQLRFYAAKGPAMVDVEIGFGSEYGPILDMTGEVSLGKKTDAISAPVE